MNDIPLHEVRNLIADAWAGQRLLNQIDQFKQEKGVKFFSRKLLEVMRDTETYDINEAYEKMNAQSTESDEVASASEMQFIPETKEAIVPDRESITRDNLAEKVSEFLSQSEAIDDKEGHA